MLLATARAGHACVCETTSFFIAWGSTPVVHGVVEQHRERERSGRSVDLRVIRVLNGIETRPTVRLWGLGESVCSVSVAALPVGTELVVALTRDGGEHGLAEDAHVLNPTCGANFVRVRESDDEPGMWLSEIERRLAAAR